MIKRIRCPPGELLIGSALRHLVPRLSVPELAYDPEHVARCNEVLLGEVVTLPRRRFDVELFIGAERVTPRGDGFDFTAEEVREGLVAIAAGNRYAPRVLVGGVRHPVTGAPNPPIHGGSEVSDLIAMNIAGHVNTVAVPHERCRIRVLGVLVDEHSQPLHLVRQAVSAGDPAAGDASTGVLVAGNAMESGKTTFCMALAAAGRLRGLRCTYEKKTGSACMRDLLRVMTGDYQCFSTPGCRVTVPGDAGLCDFVDATGAVSDVSMEPEEFVTRSLAFSRAWSSARVSDLRIVELADSLSHRTNLTLLQSPAFRRSIRHLVYIAQPSFDAVHHMWHFVREHLGWREVSLTIAGPLANDPQWACLREEMAHRLGVSTLAVPIGGQCDEATAKVLLDGLPLGERAPVC